MKLTSLAKAVRSIGLVIVLSAIEGMGMVQPAQAQVTEPQAEQSGSVCSAAYFDDPGFMYNTATQEQRDAVDRFLQNPARLQRGESMMAEITTFSAALDSPLGYVVNRVNGEEVTIPPQIQQEIRREVYERDPSPDNRRRVAELNQRYGQYVTFGQNITLLPSPEQIQVSAQDTYELLAYLESLLTPEQKQEQQAALTALGLCSPSSLFRPDRGRGLSIDVGVRPDLDERLRNDTSGATFFE